METRAEMGLDGLNARVEVVAPGNAQELLT